MNKKERLLYDCCYEEKHSEGKKSVDELFLRLLDIMDMEDWRIGGWLIWVKIFVQNVENILQ